MESRWVLLVLSLVIADASAEAHSIALKLGRFGPRVTSDLWTENLEVFTLDPSSFDAFIGGVEAAVDLSEHLDVTFGVETTSRTVGSNYREFVRDDGTEIIQDVRLRLTPLTAGVRLFPTGRSRARPFVTAGLGIHVYEYREDGEFIDFDTFDVFVDTFVDRGAAFGGYVGGGVWLALGDAVAVFGEYRRHWAKGTHGDDFDGFGRFDLGGNQAVFGIDFGF